MDHQPTPDRLSQITARLERFVAERDWDQFHSPKNLTMALAGELGELTEHFQWLTEAESRALPPATLAAVAEELADVQIYLLLLARQLKIDVLDAVSEKMAQNERKYPADAVRGSARKYTDL
jgi:dCTP diphosphatase